MLSCGTKLVLSVWIVWTILGSILAGAMMEDFWKGFKMSQAIILGVALFLLIIFGIPALIMRYL